MFKRLFLPCVIILATTGCVPIDQTSSVQDDSYDISQEPIEYLDLQIDDTETYVIPEHLVREALASTSDNHVDVGDTAVVPTWSWITVQNTQGIRSGNNDFPFGDTCGISTGHLIEAKALDEGEVLVQYHVPYTAYGTPCPDGTVFFITEGAFLSLTETYMAIDNAHEDAKSRVESLLAQDG